MGSPSSCKTCDEIFERDYRLWGYTMIIAMSTDYMDIQMQIGLEVSQTEKAHQAVVIVWDVLWFHGLAKSNPVLL